MKKHILSFLLMLLCSTTIYSQRVGFFNSQMIRDKLPDARLAEQRCQTMVDEWKRELKSMEDKEEALQFEVKKNRLIWSDVEKAQRERELSDLQNKRVQYAKDKFEPGGEYDKIVEEIMMPVEEKIFAAVQDIASKSKVDIVWDQATQPLAYVNFKYDLTLKILKTLGVDVSIEEKEQEEKIASDPRNDEERKEQEENMVRRRRSRTEKPTIDNAPATQQMQPIPDLGAPVNKTP